jgi:hypothetical protein
VGQGRSRGTTLPHNFLLIIPAVSSSLFAAPEFPRLTSFIATSTVASPTVHPVLSSRYRRSSISEVRHEAPVAPYLPRLADLGNEDQIRHRAAISAIRRPVAKPPVANSSTRPVRPKSSACELAYRTNRGRSQSPTSGHNNDGHRVARRNEH